jgi:hypothetical protein
MKKNKIKFSIYDIEDSIDCINDVINLANKNYKIKKFYLREFDDLIFIAYSKDKFSSKDSRKGLNAYLIEEGIIDNY